MSRVAFALAMVALVGCKSKSSGPEITIAAFGSKPVPPGRLAKVRAGMTMSDVKALFPDARDADRPGTRALAVDSDFRDAPYEVHFNEKGTTITSVETPPALNITESLRKAWGEPNQDGSWIDYADGYEAHVTDRTVMYFLSAPFTAAFFGTAPGPVSELAKLKVGMPEQEARAATPRFRRDSSVTSTFAPGQQDVMLVVSYVGGKVSEMNVGIPAYGVGLVEAAWGPPTITKDRDGRSRKCWDTADKTTRIELVEGPSPELAYRSMEDTTCVAP